MAHIKQCKICTRNFIEVKMDQGVCLLCQIAVLEDQLFRIQSHLKRNQKQALPVGIANEIIRGNYGRLSEYLKQLEKASEIEISSQIRDTMRAMALMKTANRFDKKHPDPKCPGI